MIDRKEYARRRKQLMRIIGRDAICIVPAAPERLRNNDSHYPYRQDSDFHYLTGFPEPEAVLALIPGAAMAKSSCSAASAMPNARPGTARAPGLKARCATTAWTTHFRSPTSTRSCPA